MVTAAVDSQRLVLLALQALSLCMVVVASEEECKDTSPGLCRRIGSHLPLSKCYKMAKKCCATCSKLALPINECPFGDKEEFCTASQLSHTDQQHQAIDCYQVNKTCCQTCHLYNSGIAGCEYGDRKSWCSSIGTRYSSSSCYDHHDTCCHTCASFRSSIPDCQYGDRQSWCSNIGITFPLSSCLTNSRDCCHTCHMLQANISALTSTTTTSTSSSFASPASATSSVLPSVVTQSPTVASRTSGQLPADRGRPGEAAAKLPTPQPSAALNFTSTLFHQSPSTTTASTTLSRTGVSQPRDRGNNRHHVGLVADVTNYDDDDYDEDDVETSKNGGSGWHRDDVIRHHRPSSPSVRYSPHRTLTETGTRMDRVIHPPTSRTDHVRQRSDVSDSLDDEDNSQWAQSQDSADDNGIYKIVYQGISLHDPELSSQSVSVSVHSHVVVLSCIVSCYSIMIGA